MMYLHSKLLQPQKTYVTVLVTLVTLIIFGLLFFTLSSSRLTTSNPQSVIAVPSVEAEEVSELPVRLVIPSIGVDAKVQHVGLADGGGGAMAVPSNFTDVGWYEGGVRPGMRGSAVIAGHLNGKNTPEAVFYDLHKLEIGDEVVIESAERIEDIFVVVRIETYDHNASTTEVFVSTDGKERLNLVTCGGEWLPEEKLYNKRTVVFTEKSTDAK